MQRVGRGWQRKPVCVCCGLFGAIFLYLFFPFLVRLRRVPAFRLQDDRLRAVIYAVLQSMSSRSALGNRTSPGKLISLCELREHDQVRETTNPTFDFKYSRLVPPTELVQFKPP